MFTFWHSLVTKHSQLEYGCLGGSSLFPQIPGFMLWCGAKGQNLGHLHKVFKCIFVMQTTSKHSFKVIDRMAI